MGGTSPVGKEVTNLSQVPQNTSVARVGQDKGKSGGPPQVQSPMQQDVGKAGPSGGRVQAIGPGGGINVAPLGQPPIGPFTQFNQGGGAPTGTEFPQPIGLGLPPEGPRIPQGTNSFIDRGPQTLSRKLGAFSSFFGR